MSASDQSRDSLPSNFRHGRSKAQMCLSKILHIISSCPSSEVSSTQCLSDEHGKLERLGFDLDLNSGVSVPPEIERFEMPAMAEVGEREEKFVFAKIDSPAEDIMAAVGAYEELQSSCKSESIAVEESEVVEHGAIEISEISNVVDQSSVIETHDEGCLGLLIDAAKLIFGDFEESEPEKPSHNAEVSQKSTRNGESTMKRKQCWTAAAEWYTELEDTSPVVKSKRGRSQVLPCKYRDSVLEPLVRWSRHRSTTAVSSKRRSK